MKLQRYLNERMVNKSPRINKNPNRTEVTNILKQSDYEMVRSLIHKKTDEMYVWDAGEKTHLHMLQYMVDNGILPELEMAEADNYYAVMIRLADNREDVEIEVRDWRMYKRIPFEKSPRLKSLFPDGTNFVGR